MEQFKKSGYGRLALVGVFIAIALVVSIFFLGNNLVETNEAGYYQVSQQFIVGDLGVRNTPGTYWQGLDKITTYELAGDIFLSKDATDGGTQSDNAAERVLFPNGYADINFVGMYEVQPGDDTRKLLHVMYNTDDGVKYMVKQQVIEALKNTGTLMSAEEAYSYKRAEFIALAREQALQGLYKSHVSIDTVPATGGGSQYIKRYSVERDADGNPIVMKESLLEKYNIALPQFNIKDMDFDPKLTALIDSRKDAQKAEQDAITEKAKGEASIAREKAIQEVDKIKLVTIAQKEKEVAILNAEQLTAVAHQAKLKAKEEKEATILAAEAKKQELLIADGLSAKDKYTIDAAKETAIGVAKETFGGKGLNLPQIMVIGGEGKGQMVDPFTAVGLESFKNMLNPASALDRNK